MDGPQYSDIMRRQQLAQILQQNTPQTANPLLAGLASFLGTQASLGAAQDLGLLRQQEMQRAAQEQARRNALDERKISLQEREFNELTKLRGEELDLKKRALETKAKESAISLDLTKGEEAVDKKFADEIVEFNAKGGIADVKKNLSQLISVRNALASGEVSTGAETRLVPEFAESLIMPKSKAAKESVEEVVQRNLRLVLGAQFTEKEGERLIARAYNQDLPEEENIKRLDRLIQQISEAAAAKANASEYFSKYGTLKGWQGSIPTIGDFESSDEMKIPKTGRRVVKYNDLTK